MPSSPHNLILTTLLDPPGRREARFLGKILASSLLRSLFGGQIVMERNFPEPLFPIERVDLKELEHDPADFLPEEVGPRAQRARVEAALRHAEAASRYGWVTFCDADVVPLRNWDHLLVYREADLLIARQADGQPDAGFFAVRGERVIEFAEEWADALAHLPARSTSGDENPPRPDEAALAQVVASGKWRVKPFERGEVVQAFAESTGLPDILSAAAVHLKGGSPAEKRKLAFALHMMWVYGDEDGVFLDILES
ncbi:hypothetical protein [Roseibacillus ishigakijimensis]|uniref:Nucleotide-diphospho-sugar transferase n=1 Tax=Roseibacillus ishigakijimensis TaxID=454146 RepID=A0A934RRN4_9BACT|nr:hypothetical protein [Roseibacillus ishigakijimensis]MBK1835658.1 hypothetical protein [Roseibacillus ishigakijimensis]